MKIIIDIGHPAHVHYFRNFILEMQSKGHKFLIVARDKEVTHKLLKYYGINYYNRRRGSTHLVGKLIYLIYANIQLLRISLGWRPNLFLSFGSPYAAHVSKLLNKPHIGLTDTEHAKLGIISFAPFSEVIITPEFFYKSFGNKHIKFNGFFELSYLNAKYFKLNKNIYSELGLQDNDKYAIVRFVSWSASHDIGQKGFSSESKIEIVKNLAKKLKVFITSESDLPEELEEYKFNILPERLHDALAFATLYVGEGATTAVESACLGTPSIYVNSLDAGTLSELAKNDLLFSFRSTEGVIEKITEILGCENFKELQTAKAKSYFENKIDPTAYLVWFVENYPQSIQILKTNPDFQDNFR
jgi:predicted glycosyltransferase